MHALANLYVRVGRTAAGNVGDGGSQVGNVSCLVTPRPTSYPVLDSNLVVGHCEDLGDLCPPTSVSTFERAVAAAARIAR